jgi:hypothetical protein
VAISLSLSRSPIHPPLGALNYSTSNMSGDTPDSILDMVLSEVANETETCYINAIEIGYMH